jgi:beta-glucosidase
MRHGLAAGLIAGVIGLAGLFPATAREPVGWREGAEARRIERRIDDLIARMTLEEKVGQLHLSGRGDGFDMRQIETGRMGAVMNFIDPFEIKQVQEAVRRSRLKIPVLIGLDAVHGFSTYFPLPLGQAATFNPELVAQAAEWTAREAAAVGINWTFAPMVDMSRDPRWGRVLEGAGEDVHLASVMAAARTRGYQRGGLAASVKHFAGYGAVEAGRDYNSTWIPTEQLHDWHLPPFKAALDAGSLTVMAAFNAINGMPATAHRGLLTDLLRTRWGFRGLVVSDFNSIGELKEHGIAADDAQAARLALMAGIDLDMMGDVYLTYLPSEVKAGRVPVSVLDEAVRRVLRVKFHLGLFEKPDVDPSKAAQALRTPPARAAARQAARESLILLENDGVLPLKPDLKRIAVIGALAEPDEGKAWTEPAGLGSTVITPLRQALADLAGASTRVDYAAGVSDACGTAWKDREEARRIAAEAEVIVATLGEDCVFMGEGASRTQLDLPGVQEELLADLVATGKPVVLVLATGRPLALTRWTGKVAAIVQTFHAGSEGRVAIAEMLTGRFNPSGKLPMSLPRSVGQVPVYYDHLPTGRPQKIRQRYESIFLDEANEPLFPFGHGLSYSRFELTRARVETPRVARAGTVRVTATLTNHGPLPGQEVVQLYVRQPVASRSRPVRQLKGFEKVFLAVGESREVTLEVPASALGFHDERGRYRVEAGMFDVFLGFSSKAPRIGGTETIIPTGTRR